MQSLAISLVLSTMMSKLYLRLTRLGDQTVYWVNIFKIQALD